MENNNNELYYTPNIEEFHVGFEYEQKEYKNNVWFNVTFSGMKWGKIKSYIEQKLFRVKYLDKEDIESLGFKLSELQSKNYEQPNTVYTKNDLYLTLWKNWVEIQNEFEIIFKAKIKIKNKSELKTLLKQLEII